MTTHPASATPPGGPPDLGLDASLTAWLAAARAGGLPQPTRVDRWQPLRAGVIGLWEFDVAEYWYAQGWVQLTGRNEAGKSSLMALTTLIPWLADTSSSSIDTLGRSGKEFRYYVEPSGKDGDRRATDASTNRGWLWVEYGRAGADAPEFFTTLLFAEARAASARVARLWNTAHGVRVRAGLDLAPGRAVAHPKDLAGPGFIAHPTASAYKEHVAQHLLGSTVERLEAAGKMLRVTRTPKLGAQLHVGFVSEHLRTALPELDRAEVDALAAGWDQLDQLRADLEATQQAVTAVERFRTGAWLPWVRAELRHRADEASRARSDFDKVTRQERQAQGDVETLTGDAARLTADAQLATRDADAAASAREVLQESDRYRDAQARIESLERRRGDVSRLSADLAERAEAARTSSIRVDTARVDVANQQAAVAEAQARADAARDLLANAAQLAGVPVPSGDVDLPLLEQRLAERRRAIERGRQLLATAGSAEGEAGRAEEAAAAAQDRAADSRSSADLAWDAADRERAAVVRAVSLWSGFAHPTPDADSVERWVATLPSEIVAAGVPGTPLRDQIRADWYDPHTIELDRRVRDAERRRGEAEAEAGELARQIEELESAPVPAFTPPDTWKRRQRPTALAEGAPLWAVVDPQPGLAGEDLARLEAALAAMGVLDAWVTPDGSYLPERDGADVVVALGADGSSDSGPRLADVLRPAGTASSLAASVVGLLGRVRLLDADDPIPQGGLAVGRDGRWRAGALAGTALPAHPNAEWLGQAARADQRRRRIAELQRQRADALERQEAAASDLALASAALSDVARAFDAAPTDAGLRTALTRAAERDDVAERAQAEAERVGQVADAKREAADRATAALREFCTDAGLPHDAGGLNTSVDRVSDTERRAVQLRSDRRGLSAQQDALASARGLMAEREADYAQAERARESVAGALADARAMVSTLEATVGADDRAIVGELEELKVREGRAKADRARTETELLRVSGRLGEARATLANAQQARERATAQRDEAFALFRVAIDRGLADEASVDLPEPHASSVEKVRDQVAVVRREVVPPRWPADDPSGQVSFERRAYERLTEAVHELRSGLETRGRSVQLVLDDVGLPRVEVLVDASGVAHSPRSAARRLAGVHEELAATYTARVQETLDELLGSTFLEHLRARVGATDNLVDRINTVLAQHPVVTTSTSLRIRLEPVDAADGRMLEALRGSMLASPEAAAHVREHLRLRVEAAKRDAALHGESDWRDRLVQTLDYRGWFEVHLQRKIGAGGRWEPLTTQSFAEMSGGARAVVLVLPLVATLAALYADMDGAPRPLWLDEAFDGLDSANRSMVMDLFRSFDLDVLLAGPNRLVNVRTVPAAAIYQVVRAPAPLPGADLTLELWAGGALTVVDVPAVLPSRGLEKEPADSPDAAQESLL